MRVASWPGRAVSHNMFVRILLDSLAEAGADVVSCDTVDDLLTVRADVILLHWPETVIWQSQGRVNLLTNIQRLKHFFKRHHKKPTKLIWLAHNLMPHRQGRLEKLLWRGYIDALVQAVDGVLTLSPGTVEVVRQHFPALAERPVSFVWHPHYPHPAVSRETARAATGFAPQDYVFGYCGQIRRYKGVDLALQSFLETTGAHLRLYLAGTPSEPAFVEELTAKARQDPRISLELEDLSGPAFEAALMRCDTIIAPFRQYLHSGSLVHALSAGCRVLTPATPFSESLAEALGGAHVTTYNGALTPDILRAQAQDTPQTPPDLSAMAPTKVAADLLAFAESVMSGEA